MIWEIREPIYNEIVKRIKETGKSYWSDRIGWWDGYFIEYVETDKYL